MILFNPADYSCHYSPAKQHRCGTHIQHTDSLQCRHLSKSEFETVLSGSECVRRPVEDAVLWTLRLENLQKAMEVLDHQSRERIDFRYDRGLTMEEIGKFYGVSKMAVSKRLRKLHQKLKGSVI